VTLQSDPSDTTIAIADTAYTVSQGDRFNVRISEGKAYRQESFFILFKDTLTYNQEDLIFNIIRLEDGAYKKYIVFETLLPAGNYDRLQFSLMSNRLSNGEPDKLKVGNFEATVVLPLDENN
ncbi:MAG: hypothetical protein GWN01_00290, partial [Nitrosopumilaceae archaeon]|nr:hypothetical protein [Nitrosopumilaceae archaeon]NIU85783.1 hypothetical protein [Nitrosopumilaceae archaeon]NIV64617.1 hypothetical protein [Nitrosopumilaceae archaeon]NIX60025.1 hypothetical protein [Nitrosopumilaceae archaeon]